MTHRRRFYTVQYSVSVPVSTPFNVLSSCRRACGLFRASGRRLIFFAVSSIPDISFSSRLNEGTAVYAVAIEKVPYLFSIGIGVVIYARNF